VMRRAAKGWTSGTIASGLEKKQTRRPADGLVLEHGEDKDQRSANEIPDMRSQSPGPVFIMGPVQEDERPPADDFQPARPFGGLQAGQDRAPVEGVFDAAQRPCRGHGDGGIFALMPALELSGGKRTARRRIRSEAETGRCAGREKRPVTAEDGDNRSAELTGPAADNLGGTPVSTPLTTGTPGLMIPAFSEAMAARVRPRYSVWSREIEVMTETKGKTTLVASNRPPCPPR